MKRLLRQFKPQHRRPLNILVFLVVYGSLLFVHALFAAEQTGEAKANSKAFAEEMSAPPSEVEVMNAVVDHLYYLENKEKGKKSERLTNTSDSPVNTEDVVKTAPLNAEVRSGEDEKTNTPSRALIPQKLPIDKAVIDQIDVEKNPIKPALEGWIYLGRFSADKWENSTLMNVGNQLPILNKRYQILSFLHLRDALPVKGKLGKAIQILNIDTQVSVRKIQSSGKHGDYWGYIQVIDPLIGD